VVSRYLLAVVLQNVHEVELTEQVKQFELQIKQVEGVFKEV
jgi:hypothetical protein